MRSLLDVQGRMQRPHSLFDALERRAQLGSELRKIEKQLRTPTAGRPFGSYATREEWKAAAEKRLSDFREEQRQLIAWIELHKDVEPLLEQAWHLLKQLEHDLGGDFEPTESAFVRRLDAYFKTADNQTQPQRNKETA